MPNFRRIGNLLLFLSSLDPFGEVAALLLLPRPPIPDVVNLLKSLSTSLRESNEGMGNTTEAKYTEDDVSPPGNIPERRRDEIGQGKVEDPVSRSSETDTPGTVVEREDLGDVNPGNGSPGKTVESDKDVGAGNNALSIAAADLPTNVVISIDVSDGPALGGHEAGDRKVESSHSNATPQKERTTTNLLNEEEGNGSGDEEDDILNG